MLSPDRALPADPATRRLAREIFAATESLPLVCMHGHVDAEVLAGDIPFGDPAQLFITPVHYVTRLIHAAGVPLAALGVRAAAGPAGSGVGAAAGPALGDVGAAGE